MDLPVDIDFTRSLPKVELHAHLSGSISKATLHEIWLQKRQVGQCQAMEDPLTALQSRPDIFTFFKIFDQYIYSLLNDKASIQQAVRAVIDDFEADGVVYLELRTTPRHIASAGIDREAYTQIVLDAIRTRTIRDGTRAIQVYLLLSIDRRMSLQEAEEVLALATKYSRLQRHESSHDSPTARAAATAVVLGIDLCGNPMQGDIGIFTPVFTRAKQAGLRVTVHFAEVPESSSELELSTLLSWQPDRLGHVINVPRHLKQIIEEQEIALELCLSCNMIAKMVEGEYADHHFGYWYRTKNRIALSTDDVGVFESSLSNEYLLASRHFRLTRSDLLTLCRRAAEAAFAGEEIRYLIDRISNDAQHLRLDDGRYSIIMDQE